MLVPPDQLLTEFIALCDREVKIPLWKDVPGVNVLRITFPSPLRRESHGITGLLGRGCCGFPLPRGHLHQKIGT